MMLRRLSSSKDIDVSGFSVVWVSVLSYVRSIVWLNDKRRLGIVYSCNHKRCEMKLKAELPQCKLLRTLSQYIVR